MARSRVNMTLAWLLLAPLAACGGSNTDVLSAGSNPGGGTGGGSPPAPPAGYQTFAQLTGDQVFEANAATIDSKSPPAYQQGGSSSNASITYSAADNTYKAVLYGIDYGTYKPGYDPVAGTTFNLDDLSGLGAGSALTYTRVATFSRDSDGNNQIHRAVIGVPTRLNDQPVGTATYTQLGVFGNASRFEQGGGVGYYTLGNSKLDLSMDFTTNKLSLALTLVGTPVNGGADQQLGYYTPKQGSVSVAGTGFSGAWTRAGSTSSYVGFFNGRFFGPQASEFGLNFGINDEDSNPQMSAAGVVVGRKR